MWVVYLETVAKFLFMFSHNILDRILEKGCIRGVRASKVGKTEY
jgi:hypothetical protein